MAMNDQDRESVNQVDETRFVKSKIEKLEKAELE